MQDLSGHHPVFAPITRLTPGLEKSNRKWVKAAKLNGAKIQQLSYQLGGKSLSKVDLAKDDAEVREVTKTPFSAIIGMLNYIAGHTKPDIAYALNVLSRYCNYPGRRHIIFLNNLVKYCEYSRDDRLKF